MVYYRTGKWPDIGLECSIEYLYDPDQGSIPAVMEFEPLGVYSNSDFQFRFPQSISDIATHGQTHEFTLPEGFEGGKIVVANESCDNNTPQTRIDIAPVGTFHILHRVLEDEIGLQECMDEVRSLYPHSNNRPEYMRLRADAEKILKFRPYIRVLSLVSNHNYRAESMISDNRYPYFENRLLNSREPHYASSFGDLVTKVSCYNSQEPLTDVDINVVLRDGLSELFTRVENSGFDYASEIIDRIVPRRTDDFDHLDKLSISICLSIFLYSERSTRAKQLFWRWCRSESHRSPSFADKEHFEDIDDESLVEFIFQIAIRNIKNAQYQGTLPIFETVRKTTSASENPRLHDLAEYHSLMQRGHGNLNTNNPSRARENFDEAISALRDSDILDQSPEGDKYVRAIDSKCKAVVRVYQDSSDLGSAITYLSGFIDQELSQIRNSNYLHDRVQGLRSELIARKYIQDRSLDLATNQLDKAIQHYRNTGERTDEDQSLRLFIQQKAITAYQSETVGAFQNAAETYDEISILAQEGLKSRNSEKSFTIRSHLCTAKHAILNNDLDEAKKHINSITELGLARRENKAVESVIEFLEDYEDRRISTSEIEPKIVSEKLSGMLFNIEVDYGPASSVLPAVQHIRQYGFEKDLLDPMVMITLQNCFIPADAEGTHSVEPKSLDNSEYSYLVELSTSDRWQAKLPSHVHYRIEQLKINEVSTAGDYLPLADQATTILELFLEVFSDYYSNTIDEVSPPNSTIIPLIEFIYSMPDGSVPNISDAKSILKDSVLENDHIGRARNTTHHGEKIHINEGEYKEIRNCVMNVLHSLSAASPIIVEVIDKSELGPYLIAIHWGGPGSRSWVNTNADLEIGELYYLPSGSIERSHIIEVPEQEIVACTKERARQARKAGKEIFD